MSKKLEYTNHAGKELTKYEATDLVSDTLGRDVGKGMQGSRQSVVTVWERSGSVTKEWLKDVPSLSVMHMDAKQQT